MSNEQEEVEAPAEDGEGHLEEDRRRQEELRAKLMERRDAALAHVVKFGDPVLRSRATEVTEFDENLHEEVRRMVAIMSEGMGVGLAATQLGILRRLLVFQAGPDAPPRAIINPEVEWLSKESETAEEGCLSLPLVTMDVDRPLHARVRGRDELGEEIVIEASGLEARVLQHEMDHLDGVLILDRTARDQRKGALKALRAGESYHPPGADEDSEVGAPADADAAGATA